MFTEFLIFFPVLINFEPKKTLWLWVFAAYKFMDYRSFMYRIMLFWRPCLYHHVQWLKHLLGYCV